MARTDELLRTIETIHRAGLDTTLWPEALGAITRCMEGTAATLEVYGKQPLRHLEVHAFGFPPAREVEYAAHYLPLNERLPVVSRQPTGSIGFDYQILD
jgi:hypothetical protein